MNRYREAIPGMERIFRNHYCDRMDVATDYCVKACRRKEPWRAFIAEDKRRLKFEKLIEDGKAEGYFKEVTRR